MNQREQRGLEEWLIRVVGLNSGGIKNEVADFFGELLFGGNLQATGRTSNKRVRIDHCLHWDWGE